MPENPTEPPVRPVKPVRSVNPVRSGAWVGIGLGVQNVAAYALTIVAAHRLGPGGYGAFAALLGLVLLLNVVSLGLQATVARRVALGVADRASVERSAKRAARRAALALAVVCLVASPLVARLLQLDSWVTAALLAVPAAAYAVLGADAGLLQGEERWPAFAATFASFGLARLGLGLVGVLLWPHPLGAMAGVAAGAVVPAVVAARATRTRGPAHAAEATDGRDIVGEAVHGSHTLLAFFALSSVDVIASRTFLPAHEAGLYAAGTILVKAVLFLPFIITVLVFPALARRGGRGRLHLLGLAGVLAVGAVVAAGVAVLPRVALVFVGGQAYAEITGLLWAFAAVGAVLAAIQLLVYTALARQHPGAVWVLWGATIVIVVGLVLGLADTAPGLLALVAAVDVVTLLVLVWMTRADEDDPS